MGVDGRTIALGAAAIDLLQLHIRFSACRHVRQVAWQRQLAAIPHELRYSPCQDPEVGAAFPGLWRLQKVLHRLRDGVRNPSLVSVVKGLTEVCLLVAPSHLEDDLLELVLLLPSAGQGLTLVLRPEDVKGSDQDHHIGNVRMLRCIGDIHVHRIGETPQLREGVRHPEVTELRVRLRLNDAMLGNENAKLADEAKGGDEDQWDAELLADRP
mmetsp:Transcript_120638/g.257663  ORF Transcript_120638/g.257663 Transcript_120638/m.257663 type:complete len:212 (-) Transcript_120638:478-1113(-)